MKDIPEDKPLVRLGAPEHLDRALYITTPKGWLALLVLLVVLAAVVAWTILGKVSTYVEAQGIIISRGGVIFDATAAADGRLVRVLPEVGANVSAGETVAEIIDTEILERHAGAQALTQEWAEALQQRMAEARQENALMERNLAKRRARLTELEQSGRELVESTRARLDKDRALLERGIANQSRVEQGEQDLDEAQRNLIDTLRQRDEMEAADLRRRNTLNLLISEARTELANARRRVNELAAVMETWRIPAPASGSVTEIKAQIGVKLQTGEPVLSLETGSRRIEALFFAPPADAKRIKAGMVALVAPSSIKHEEFGYMLGVVESRSEFPVSMAGMMATLQNETLARTFFRAGAPYSGRIRLEVDPANASGYAWTLPRGAQVTIEPGSLARIEVRVARRRPIALLVPWAKEKLDF